MNRGRPRYLGDITHIDQRRAPVGFHQDSNRSFAEAVTECDALSHGDARDTDVVRRFFGKIHRAANGERIIGGVESCYRGAICTLHQTSSVSSRWIIQPLASSAATIAGRSSIRIPARIASPPGESAFRITGNSAISTEEMMFASTTRTGANSGRMIVASPSITSTRPLTPLASGRLREVPAIPTRRAPRSLRHG